MKKLLTGIAVCCLLTLSAHAQLNQFASEFEKLVDGITHDISPNLQMNALSGNIVGDATIDNFMLFLPAVGFTFTDGAAKVMRDGSLILLPGILDSVLGSTATFHALEGSFFPNATVKLGVGFGLGNGYDIIVSGTYLPAALFTAILSGIGPLSSTGITINSWNVGAEFRKSFLKDSDSLPALSLGILYNLSYFNMDIANMSLSSLSGTANGYDVGSGNYLNLSGSMNFNVIAHNIGLDLHLSKHLLIFTPYIKLTGVYEYSITNGYANLTATFRDAANAVVQPDVAIRASPTVVNSQFSALTTIGFDINCFIFILNINAMIDLGRANLNIKDISLTGITGRGVSLNAGLRWQF